MGREWKAWKLSFSALKKITEIHTKNPELAEQILQRSTVVVLTEAAIEEYYRTGSVKEDCKCKNNTYTKQN